MRSLPRRAAHLGPLFLIPAVLAAQDASPPPTAELDAAAEAARRAPLFAAHVPLSFTLRTRVAYLEDERPDSQDIDGWLSWVDEAGDTLSVDIGVRARGNFRRAKRNCSFPPLRLDIPRTRVGGTVLEGQDKLKLVMPCRDRDEYRQYVLKEFLAYRLYNLLTEVSYRVRRVEMTLQDLDEDFDTVTWTGFVIEEDEMLAARHRARAVTMESLHPRAANQEHATLLALFQYLIGNTDWSQVFFHNVDVLLTWEHGGFLTVPYDFDSSGLVDAGYATPDPQLGTRDVRQRVYRGFCRDDADYRTLRARFLERKEAILAMPGDIPELSDRERKRTRDYLEDFFDSVENDFNYQRMVTENCQPIPG